MCSAPEGARSQPPWAARWRSDGNFRHSNQLWVGKDGFCDSNASAIRSRLAEISSIPSSIGITHPKPAIMHFHTPPTAKRCQGRERQLAYRCFPPAMMMKKSVIGEKLFYHLIQFNSVLFVWRLFTIKLSLGASQRQKPRARTPRSAQWRGKTPF